MLTEDLKVYLESQGYRSLRELPDGTIIGVCRQMFTTGLFVGLTSFSYSHRYCYELWNDATKACRMWDGTGDPPGPWIKLKGTKEERLGPGAKTEV